MEPFLRVHGKVMKLLRFTMGLGNRKSLHFNKHRPIRFCKTQADITKVDIKILDQICRHSYNKIEVFDYLRTHDTLEDILDWRTKAAKHTVIGANHTLLRMMIMAYMGVKGKDNLTEDDIELAHVVGWLLELLYCYVLIIDDIMDKGTKRRGRECWYLREDVGLKGLYDALLIYATINDTLKQKFLNSHKYGIMTRIVLKCIHDTLLGQKCELETSNTVCCAYKMALNLANISNEEVWRVSTYVLHNVGYLFQIQDDIYDYKVDDESKAIGGTDIANGRCTWLITTALEKGSPEQKRVLGENYGVIDESAVRSVKNIYNQLNILTIHANSTIEIIVKSTQDYIKQIPDPNVQNSLSALLHQIIIKYE